MVVFVVFVLLLAAVGAVGGTRAGWIASAVAALFTLGLVGLTTWYVFSDDRYGSNRWDSHDTGAHDLYSAAIAVAAVLLMLYAVLAVRRVRGPAVRAAVILGGALEAFGALVLALSFGSA